MTTGQRQRLGGTGRPPSPSRAEHFYEVVPASAPTPATGTGQGLGIVRDALVARITYLRTAMRLARTKSLLSGRAHIWRHWRDRLAGPLHRALGSIHVPPRNRPLLERTGPHAVLQRGIPEWRAERPGEVRVLQELRLVREAAEVGVLDCVQQVACYAARVRGAAARGWRWRALMLPQRRLQDVRAGAALALLHIGTHGVKVADMGLVLAVRTVDYWATEGGEHILGVVDYPLVPDVKCCSELGLKVVADTLVVGAVANRIIRARSISIVFRVRE